MHTSILKKKTGSIYTHICAYKCIFLLSVLVISKVTDHNPKCFKVFFCYSRGVGCQKSSEIYLCCHLAAVTRDVPPRGFVHSFVWLLLLHRLQLHCYQVRRGKLYGTLRVLWERGGRWRAHCWPSDQADGGIGRAGAAGSIGAAGKFHPGCCTGNTWSLDCLLTPAAQGNCRKSVNSSCREQ